MRGTAIEELRASFDEPFSTLGRDATADRGRIVVSWPSMPIELAHAAGLAPVFARGSGLPTPAADRVLERDVFPNRLRQLVESALDGRLTHVGAVVIPRSSDADYKCFLYLRELTRLGTARALPPVLLFDLLHSDDADARAYNADRVSAFAAELANVAARPIAPDDVLGAIASANRARAAARRLAALRAEGPRLRGVDGLPLLGAFWQLAPERYVALANAAAESVAERAPLEGVRVLLAGTPADTTALHAAIENAEGIVSKELSPFGACGVGADVEPSGDPFAALARHYMRASIDARVQGERLMRALGDALDGVQAVVFSQPSDDAAFGWDLPRIRALLAPQRIPHAVVTADPAGGAAPVDRASIESLLASAAARHEAHHG